MTPEPKFYLNCTGSIALPRITHTIFTDHKRDACVECEKIVPFLHLAGYWQFHLYSVDDPNKCIARFVVKPASVTVETQEFPHE